MESFTAAIYPLDNGWCVTRGFDTYYCWRWKQVLFVLEHSRLPELEIDFEPMPPSHKERYALINFHGNSGYRKGSGMLDISPPASKFVFRSVDEFFKWLEDWMLRGKKPEILI